MPISPIIPLLALGVASALRGQPTGTTFAGCYQDSTIPSGLISVSGSSIGSNIDCMAYCSAAMDGDTQLYTYALYTQSSNTCRCSAVSPPASGLMPASGTSSTPTCGQTDVYATLLHTSSNFTSCSTSSSTTAQLAKSNVASSSECLSSCTSYPVTYFFPTSNGYNCYCAMTSQTAGGLGMTSCGGSTFYAYSQPTPKRRSRRRSLRVVMRELLEGGEEE